MKLKKSLFCLSALSLCALAVSACKKDENTIKVGILQFMTHDALNKATDGFKQQILDSCPEGKKVEFIVKNPEQDMASMQTMATSLVRECDLVMGNATPAATQLVAAAASEGKTDLPILFTSVTDPVSAELVSSMTSPGGNVTGTSDINPVSMQMDLAIDLAGDSCTVGFLYTATEANSKVQCDEATRYLRTAYPNVKIETLTVPDQSSISSVTTSLSQKCDVMYIPTDNLLAANMTTVANVTNPAKVPLICGESSMVDNGGTFSLSIGYYELGKTTGEMASKILFEGVKPSEIAVGTQTDVSKFEFAINNSAITAMNLTLTDSFKTKYNIN